MGPIVVPMLSALQRRAPLHERRRSGASVSALLVRMLDEIDYGLLLVSEAGELRYANQMALNEVGGAGPLRLEGKQLATAPAGEMCRLRSALSDAARGRRTLLTLGYNGHALPMAVVPIEGAGGVGGENLALLVFNKRADCTALTIAFYARANGLTATESSVLLHLSQGRKPKEVARLRGVALSTLRSQITSIRSKTHTASLSELARRVAVLPPFAPALKAAPCDGERADSYRERTRAIALPGHALPGHVRVGLLPVAAAAC